MGVETDWKARFIANGCQDRLKGNANGSGDSLKVKAYC